MPPTSLRPDQYRSFLSMVALQCGCRLTRFDPDHGTAHLTGRRQDLRRCRRRLLAVAGLGDPAGDGIRPPAGLPEPLA